MELMPIQLFQLISKSTLLLLILFQLGACQNSNSSSESKEKAIEKEEDSSIAPALDITAAMRKVMWKGELEAKIRFDSLNLDDYYGLGPLEGLAGELMIWNGKVWVSRFISADSMQVSEDPRSGAPFFVGSRIKNWQKIELPTYIKDIHSLEKFLDEQAYYSGQPYAFRLEGRLSYADIHLQNLKPGSKVSSPEEAHAGQTNYQLENINADILGFYSQEHQGVFTHHDSHLHMHLLSKDQQWMGHLDSANFNQIILFIPES
ncbi:acetolactate decarboxylase [Croceimicrobium hydrocarbonivorans]|uniref:Acetolactate decarboxylase n=1 Tax=Croceimicrobium hydrocarbonivorans TaxID=2761580 RepID=A0A7H0VDT7_9FLAO|nr:acetolactate decarboxylase [Croceimicrobium hydrocarbonivorans]QNR23885.1 acetolactate decarboxylase [Croceimicrobium hydrocarbonivorans]